MNSKRRISRTETHDIMKIKFTGLLFAFCAFAAVSTAAPIRHSTFFATQPDGKTLELTMVGDEFGVMTVTTDGFAVTSGSDGVWRYVESVTDGKPVAGSTLAHNKADRSFSETLRLEAIDRTGISAQLLNANRRHDSSPLVTRAAAKPGDYSIRPDYLTEGKPKVLVVLVEFPDLKFTKDSAAIRNMYDTIYNVTCTKGTVTYQKLSFERASGSVSDYFDKQSYGKYIPSFDVIGPYLAKNGYATYGKNDGGQGGNDSNNAQKLAIEICDNLSAGGLDLSQYDSNGDGIVDLMAIIYAGNGENYVGSDPNTIWPHNWQFTKTYGSKIQKVNYFFTCELFAETTDVIDGIGVFCHEYSHTLGLPDFYFPSNDVTDYNTDSPAMGLWSIMDYGCYEHAGFYPIGYTAFERFSIGWIELPEAQPGQNKLQRINNGHAMRLSTDDDNRFFVLENHRKFQWDAKQRTTGLMVTAVSYDSLSWANNLEINKRPDNMRYYIIPADNNRQRNTASQDLFPPSKNTALDSLTWTSVTPLSIDGHRALFNIYDIKKVSSEVYFTLEDQLRGGETWVDAPKADNGIDGATVYDLSGHRQPFGLDKLPKGIWIVTDRDGRSHKLSVR